MKKIKLIISSVVLVVLLCIGLIGYKVYKSFKQSLDGQVTAINNTTQEVNNIKNSINSVAGQLNNNYKLTNDSLSSVNLNLVINNYDIALDLRDINPTVAAKSLFVGKNKISLNVPNETEVLINGRKYHDNFILELDTLSKSNKISIELQKENGDYRKVLIPTLPSTFPNIEISGSSNQTLKGDFYGNVNGLGYVYKMSSTGEILYYYKSDATTGDLFDFKKTTINNKAYYSFFEPVDEFNKIITHGLYFGEVVVLNNDYEEIHRYKLHKTNKLPQGGYAEAHDYIILGDNHYVLLGAVLIPMTMQDGSVTQMRTAYIQEVKNNEVIFEWLSSEHDELSNAYYELGTENVDYMHTNSITIDKTDNNFVISNRNQNSVIKIDRETGEILWTLGGKNDDFNLNSNQQLSRQHYAYFDYNNNLLLFDNGNDNKKTQIKNFELDEENKKIVNFKSYEFGNKFSEFCGSVQQISDDLYLIGWGVSSDNVIATIFDFKNEKRIMDIISTKTSTYRMQYFE